MKTSEHILTLASHIERTIVDNPLALPNRDSLGRIKRLASRMRPHCTYCADKAETIAFLAGEFYSTSKHEAYRDGAAGLLVEIDLLLDRIRSRATNMTSSGD